MPRQWRGNRARLRVPAACFNLRRPGAAAAATLPQPTPFGRPMGARAVAVARSVASLGRAHFAECSLSLRPSGACGGRFGPAVPPQGR